MKSIVSFFVFCLLCQPLICQSTPLELRLATQEWPPYQTYENEILDGEAVRIVKCILEKMGQPYKIDVFPWKRAQKLVEDGQYHGFFAASKNEERDGYATLSAPIALQKWNWYVSKKTAFDPDDASFKGTAAVAARFGSNMLEWLEENGYNVVVRPYTTEKIVELLARERIDAALASESVFEEIMASKQISPDKFHVVTHRNKPLGVYFSNDFLSGHPEFLQKFNETIGQCPGN